MLFLNKNIASSLITHNLSQFLNIIAHFIILRSVVSEEYGLYAYYSIFIDLIMLFFGASIIQSGIAVKGITGIYSNILFQILIINLFILSFSFLFIFFIYNGDYKMFLILLIFSRVIALIGAVNLSMVFDRQGKFAVSSIIRLFASLVTISVSIYVVFFTNIKGLFLLLIRDLCNSLVLLIPLAFFVGKINFNSIKIIHQIKILKFSINRSIVRITELIFHKSPILIVEYLFGLKTVGVISLGIYLVGLFTSTLQRLFDIYFVKYIKLKKQLNTSYYSNLNILLIKIISPFCLFLYMQGEYFLEFIYGENWEGLLSTIKFLFLAIPLSLIVFNYETFKLSTHQFREISIGYIFSTFLSFILIIICFKYELENIFISISIFISYLSLILFTHLKKIDLLSGFIDKKDILFFLSIFLLDSFFYYNFFSKFVIFLITIIIISIYILANSRLYISYFNLIKR